MCVRVRVNLDVCGLHISVCVCARGVNLDEFVLVVHQGEAARGEQHLTLKRK